MPFTNADNLIFSYNSFKSKRNLYMNKSKRNLKYFWSQYKTPNTLNQPCPTKDHMVPVTGRSLCTLSFLKQSSLYQWDPTKDWLMELTPLLVLYKNHAYVGRITTREVTTYIKLSLWEPAQQSATILIAAASELDIVS